MDENILSFLDAKFSKVESKKKVKKEKLNPKDQCDLKMAFKALNESTEDVDIYSSIVDQKSKKNKFAEYKQFFNGKHIPEKFAEVPYNYSELSDPNKYVFKMSILTGFCGMAVDAQGFIRPQIGWSIHCMDPENSPKTSSKRSY